MSYEYALQAGTTTSSKTEITPETDYEVVENRLLNHLTTCKKSETNVKSKQKKISDFQYTNIVERQETRNRRSF